MSVKRKWICTRAMFLKMVIEKRWNVRLLLDQNSCLGLTHKMKQNIREQNAVTILEGTKIQIVLKLCRVLYQRTTR